MGEDLVLLETLIFLHGSNWVIAEHKRILHSVTAIVLFVVLAKAVAALKEVSIAWKYGIGDVVDAYQLTSTFMLWLPSMLASAVTLVLVPMFVQLANEDDNRKQFVNELKTNSILLGIILGAILVILVPILIPLLTNNITSETHTLIGTFCWFFFVPAVCTGLIAIYSSHLISQHKQWNSLLECIPALSILICVLFWSSDTVFIPLLFGTIFGYIIQTIILSKLSKSTFSFDFTFSFKNKFWGESKKFIGLMFFAQFLMSWITPIDMVNAADLGNGSIAIFSYAERLISLFLGLGAVAISRAILPVFSEIISNGNYVKLKTISIQWSIFMFLFGILVAIIGWILAPVLIKVIFQRGEFTIADTLAVTEVFRYGLLRLPFYFSGLVLLQLFICQKSYLAIIFINLVCVLSKYSLNNYFCDNFGIAGLNISTAIMYAWTALSLILSSSYLFSKKM